MRAHSQPVFFLIAAAALCCSASLADSGSPLLVPSFQERTVSAHAMATGDLITDSDSDADAADDFGPFSASVNASTVAWYPVCGSSSAASQESAITADGIQGSGGVSYTLYITGSGGDVFVSVWSRVEVTFVLSRPSDYTLQGLLACGDLFGQCRLTLVGPGGAIHDVGSGWQDTVVDESGTLAAGEYTFEIFTGYQGGFVGFPWETGGAANYDFNLDFSGSGPGAPGGEVPDGQQGNPLRVAKLPGDFVRLTWDASCRPADDDYAVYEGPLGDPLGLSPVICSTGGQQQYDFQPAFDDAMFIVVPTDGTTEGSYGDTSSSNERLPSATACLPQLLGAPICP